MTDTAADATTDELDHEHLEEPAEDLARIRTFLTSVVRTEQLTPLMRQITVGGAGLAAFEPLAPDQFLYVLAPPPGRTELTIDAGFTWEQYVALPAEERPVGAYYTVRRWRPEVHEIDLVVVLHAEHDPDHDHAADPGFGAGAAWGRRAALGDAVALWGPRAGFRPPAATERYVLVGDETGMHAIAAILEHLPEDARADVIVEVAGPEERLPMRDGPNVVVTWFHRGDAPAGTTSLLLDAVREVPALDPATTYAWGGAESRCVTAIRRHLRREVGMSREAVSMTGYWRR